MEQVYVVLNPLQREPLIVQTRVRDGPCGEREARPVEEAEIAQTVVDGHVDHGTRRVR